MPTTTPVDAPLPNAGETASETAAALDDRTAGPIAGAGLKPIGQWGLAWRRLRRHKLAMIGLVILIVVVLASLAAQWIAPYDPDAIDLRRAYAPLMSPGEAGRPVHLLGTDALGRDMASRLLYAGRYS